MPMQPQPIPPVAIRHCSSCTNRFLEGRLWQYLTHRLKSMENSNYGDTAHLNESSVAYIIYKGEEKYPFGLALNRAEQL